MHNHALLHDRLAYVDGEGHVRHNLRGWIAAEGARPLPEVFIERWGSNVIGARGGVGLKGKPSHAPLFSKASLPQAEASLVPEAAM